MKMTIEKFFRTLLAAVFAVGLATEIFAASPGELHYQGKVTNSAGVPLPDGTVNLVFSLWNAANGGAKFVGSDVTVNNVPIANGVFAANFVPPLATIQANTTVYLQVEVNGKVFDTPRQRLVAAPFALSIAGDSVRTAEIKDGEVALVDMDTANVDTRYATLATAQPISAVKTFSAAPSFTAAGTPFSVTNSGLVANLNADLLDGQTGSFYQNASNLSAGTVPNARVDGSSITKMGNTFNGSGELIKFSPGTTNYPAGDGSAISNVNASGVANNSVDTNKILDGEVALVDMDTANVDTRYATLATAQPISAVKTFSAAPSFTAAGTPFSVTNSGLVANLNADLLDGQTGSFYTNAGNLTGSIPNAAIDSSSITKMGNTFNSGSELLQLSGGLVPNANVDGSSITKMGSAFGGNNQLLKLSATGLVPNANVDGSSITKMGNTFNSGTNLLQLTGGLVPNANVDGSSITKMGNTFNSGTNLLQLTGGLVPNANVDGSSITKMGNNFNGNGQLVKFPTGATTYPAGNGSALTSLTAGNISAGSLGPNVIASSVAVNSITNAQVSAAAAISASKIVGGTFGSGTDFQIAAGDSLGIGVAPSNTLQVNGPIATKIRSVSANTSLDATDSIVIVDTSGGNRTITLPVMDATTAGRELKIFNVGTNNLTIQRQGGSEKINNANSLTSTTRYEVFVVVGDGSDWWAAKLTP